MTRFGLAALGAAMALGACTPPEITSRADNYDTLNSGFSAAGDTADADGWRGCTGALEKRQPG